MPILLFGTEAQKSHYLPRLASGAMIGAHAMTEPDAGSDALALTARAVRRGSRYVLSGTKSFCTNAPVADYSWCSRRWTPRSGLRVSRRSWSTPALPGVGAPVDKLGLRTSPMASVHLDACEVSEDQRLGREGGGAVIFHRTMDRERIFILASQVGTMARRLDACLQYVRGRRQFGQPIGKFQLVAEKLVHMRVRLDAARLLLYRAAWSKAQGKSATLDASVAKLFISEAAVDSALDAVQAYGGYGYTAEFEVERELRDAVGGRLYSGTSEIQTMVIARLLGL